MQPVASTRPASAYLRRNLCDGATCTTRSRASASLQDRLGNPSQTCFDAKQAARSRRVSRANLPPSVLWCNRQTEAHLILRHKPRNRRGDFKDPNHQIRAVSFEAQTKKPSTTLVLRLNPDLSTARPLSTRPVRPSPVLCIRSPTPVTVLVAARHVAPTTCTPRDKQTRFKIKVKEKQNKTIPDSNSNITKSMTHHNQTK
jgi:hypothetical protein